MISHDITVHAMQLKRMLKKVYLKLTKLSRNDHIKETPVFILGSWRGGTTLVQRILNSVDGVAIWGEQGWWLTKIAEAYFQMYENDVSSRNLRRSESAGNIVYKNILGNPNHWSAWTNIYDSESFKILFRKFVMSLYVPPDIKVKHWGFKEIRYGMRDRVIEFLNDLFPEARFIFIARNPIDNILSQVATRKDKSKLPAMAKRWAFKNQAYLDFTDNNVDRSRIVRYEDIITEETRTLEDLFQFLGLPLSEEQYEVLHLKQGRGKTPESQKREYALTPEEVNSVWDITADIGIRLGYRR
jgi:hypothetical protein